MIPAGFKQALITYAETLGSVGTQTLIDECAELFARMQDGDGQNIVNSSINGKSFGFQVNMTIEEKFSVYGEAIRDLTGSRVVQTSADFRWLTR